MWGNVLVRAGPTLPRLCPDKVQRTRSPISIAVSRPTITVGLHRRRRLRRLLFLRHRPPYGCHIPGNPATALQKVPGAGSRAATNWLYNLAPKTALLSAP